MADYVTIGGLKIEVVSAAEAEQVAYVVCGRASDPSPFTDNVHTTCGMCGAAIMHRPHAPAAPMKICVPCMVARAEAEEGLN
jgi:hypothetical protein